MRLMAWLRNHLPLHIHISTHTYHTHAHWTHPHTHTHTHRHTHTHTHTPRERLCTYLDTISCHRNGLQGLRVLTKLVTATNRFQRKIAPKPPPAILPSVGCRDHRSTVPWLVARPPSLAKHTKQLQETYPAFQPPFCCITGSDLHGTACDPLTVSSLSTFSSKGGSESLLRHCCCC